ncbi:hypothetical protein LMG26691_00410 [Achromobacter animicus]|nr:hypothetical protein LMG26691_00410 [Achromobacter animicus]
MELWCRSPPRHWVVVTRRMLRERYLLSGSTATFPLAAANLR